MTTSDDKTPTEPTAEGGSTADSLRRALAMKRKGAGGPGGLGGERPAEKLVASKTIAANKPMFRRASKRG